MTSLTVAKRDAPSVGPIPKRRRREDTSSASLLNLPPPQAQRLQPKKTDGISPESDDLTVVVKFLPNYREIADVLTVLRRQLYSMGCRNRSLHVDPFASVQPTASRKTLFLTMRTLQDTQDMLKLDGFVIIGQAIVVERVVKNYKSIQNIYQQQQRQQPQTRSPGSAKGHASLNKALTGLAAAHGTLPDASIAMDPRELFAKTPDRPHDAADLVGNEKMPPTAPATADLSKTRNILAKLGCAMPPGGSPTRLQARGEKILPPSPRGGANGKRQLPNIMPPPSLCQKNISRRVSLEGDKETPFIQEKENGDAATGTGPDSPAPRTPRVGDTTDDDDSLWDDFKPQESPKKTPERDLVSFSRAENDRLKLKYGQHKQESQSEQASVKRKIEASRKRYSDREAKLSKKHAKAIARLESDHQEEPEAVQANNLELIESAKSSQTVDAQSLKKKSDESLSKRDAQHQRQVSKLIEEVSKQTDITKKLRKELSALREKIDEAEEAKMELKSELDASKKHSKRLMKLKKEEYEEKLEKLQQELDDSELERFTAVHELERINSINEKAIEGLEQTRQGEIEIIQGNLDAANQRVEFCEAKIDSLESKLSSTDLTASSSEIAALRAEIAAEQRKTSSLQEQLENAQMELCFAQASGSSDSEDKIAALQEKVERLERDELSVCARLSQADIEKSELREQSKKCEAKLALALLDAEKLRTKCDEWAAMFVESRKQLEEAKEQLAMARMVSPPTGNIDSSFGDLQQRLLAVDTMRREEAKRSSLLDDSLKVQMKNFMAERDARIAAETLMAEEKRAREEAEARLASLEESKLNIEDVLKTERANRMQFESTLRQLNKLMACGGADAKNERQTKEESKTRLIL